MKEDNVTQKTHSNFLQYRVDVYKKIKFGHNLAFNFKQWQKVSKILWIYVVKKEPGQSQEPSCSAVTSLTFQKIFNKYVPIELGQNKW